MCFSFLLPARKSTRLQGWDYRWGGIYFVTICTAGRQMLFGSIEGDEVLLNDFGRITDEEWRRAEVLRENVALGEHVVMPNHVHGLISLGETPELLPSNSRTLQPGSLSSIIGQFKSRVARRINELREGDRGAIWQRGFYDRIVRTETELQAIREYIVTNPSRWTWDRENPAGVRPGD